MKVVQIIQICHIFYLQPLYLVQQLVCILVDLILDNLSSLYSILLKEIIFHVFPRRVCFSDVVDTVTEYYNINICLEVQLITMRYKLTICYRRSHFSTFRPRCNTEYGNGWPYWSQRVDNGYVGLRLESSVPLATAGGLPHMSPAL